MSTRTATRSGPKKQAAVSLGLLYPHIPRDWSEGEADTAVQCKEGAKRKRRQAKRITKLESKRSWRLL